MQLITFLFIGALAGFAAGLFGIGGGLIIVPLLFFVFTQLGYDPEIVMHLALGTSLATIVVTSISSAMAHHKKQGIVWSVVRNLAPGMLLGSFFGAGIAALIAGSHLQIIIGVFVIWVAYQMLFASKPTEDLPPQLPSRLKQISAGAGIGVASAIFGIGGGSLTVPYLNHYRLVMQKAVGTSAACGLPIALAGALGFMFFGAKTQGDIANSIGYVHLYAFVGISGMSFLTAKLGAQTAHLLSALLLKRAFALMLLAVGLYFVFG